MRLILFMSLTALAMLLASCKSADYYKARAVEKARDYAVPRIRDLDPSQIDYVRYAPPVLMDAEVFTRYMTDDKNPSKNDIYQTCVVWDVPGLDYSIIVFGVSERRMDDWYPNRVIRKKFLPVNANRANAVAVAVDYVMNNMLYLSDELRNRIRFAPPQVVRTDFYLDIDRNLLKDRKMTRKEQDALAIKRKHLVQYSLVWDTFDPEEKVVVSGLAYDTLEEWEVFSGIVRKTSDLSEHTVVAKAVDNEINLDGEGPEAGKTQEPRPPATSKEKLPEMEITQPESGSQDNLNKFKR